MIRSISAATSKSSESCKSSSFRRATSERGVIFFSVVALDDGGGGGVEGRLPFPFIFFFIPLKIPFFCSDLEEVGPSATERSGLLNLPFDLLLLLLLLLLLFLATRPKLPKLVRMSRFVGGSDLFRVCDTSTGTLFCLATGTDVSPNFLRSSISFWVTSRTEEGSDSDRRCLFFLAGLGGGGGRNTAGADAEAEAEADTAPGEKARPNPNVFSTDSLCFSAAV